MRRRHSRYNFAGTLHFVTTVTRVRGRWFISDDICSFLLQLFEKYRIVSGVGCAGYVLMPDHFHALLYQELDGPAVSKLMADFKRESSKQLRLPEFTGSTLWRDGYDDFAMPGINAARIRLNYLHFNPVRRNLVERPEQYKWSSAPHYFDESVQSLIAIRHL